MLHRHTARMALDDELSVSSYPLFRCMKASLFTGQHRHQGHHQRRRRRRPSCFGPCEGIISEFSFIIFKFFFMLLGGENNLQIGNVGVGHYGAEIRHATSAAKLVGHVAETRVAHQVVHEVGVAHEVLGHAGEHGVAHDGAEIGHAASATGTAAAEHGGEVAEVGHAAGTGTGTGSGAGEVVLGLLLLLDAALGRLEALLHGLGAAVALVLDALLVGFHGALGVAEGEAGEAQAGPGLGVGRVDGDGGLGVDAGGLVVSGGGVGGGAVGEEDCVGGVQGEGLGVEVNGGGVVLLGHGGVALGLEGFGFFLLGVGGLGG